MQNNENNETTERVIREIQIQKTNSK